MAEKNNKIGYTTLAVDKGYFNNVELNPLKMLILSQVDEYLRSTGVCCVTNEQFATYFNVNESTVKRAIEDLEEKGYLKRNTTLKKDNGQASRVRTLEHGDQWALRVMPHRIIIEN